MSKKVKAPKSKATKTKAAKPKKVKKADKDAQVLVDTAPKTVEIELKLPITDAEARKRGCLANQKRKERDVLILKKKEVSGEYQAKIKSLDAEVTTLLEEFETSREARLVKARVIRNFAKKQVEFHYKGVCELTRPMTTEDHQDELPLGDKPGVIPKVVAHADISPANTKTLQPRKLKEGEMLKEGTAPVGLSIVRHDPIADAHAADEQAKRSDVADVIREETSVRSKWSSTDGARE